MNPNNLKVGDIVLPINAAQLFSGSARYGSAVVDSVDPFRLSVPGMTWSCHDPRNFEKMGLAPVKRYWFRLSIRGLNSGHGRPQTVTAPCTYESPNVTGARVAEAARLMGLRLGAVLLSQDYLGYMTEQEYKNGL